MMKSKCIVTATLCLSMLTAGWAQKENVRKAAILQTALEEFFTAGNPDAGLMRWDRSPAQGTYIPGFGIVLKAPAYQLQPMVIDQHKPSSDSLHTNLKQKIIDLMTSFLENYGSLASSLSPQEKIMVHYDHADREGFRYFYVKGPDDFIQNGEQPDAEDFESITAEVSQEDIRQYPSDLKNHIKIEVTRADNDQLPYRVLGKIWYQLLEDPANNFGNAMSDAKFNIRNDIDFQVLNGFGVMYHISLANPFFTTQHMRQKAVIEFKDATTISKGSYAPKLADMGDEKMPDKKIKDLDKVTDSVYTAFRQQWKQNMVEYGRTLKNLPSGQRLMVHFELPECADCPIPSQVRFVVAQDVLSDYDQGKLKLEQAVEKVQVEESGKASE